MSVSVCVLSVCSLFASISQELCFRSSQNFFLHVTYGRGSILVRSGGETSRTSCFVDDVVFTHNGPDRGMSTPLQRVTSLRRRAQANTPAASYWLRCVLDDGGRRD